MQIFTHFYLKFFFNIFRAPFSTLRSTSPYFTEHVSTPYGALLPTIQSMPLYTYGARLSILLSIAL